MSIPSTWVLATDGNSATFTNTAGATFTVAQPILGFVQNVTNWVGGDPVEDAVSSNNIAKSQLFTALEMVVEADGVTVTIGNAGEQLFNAESQYATLQDELTKAQTEAASLQTQLTSVQTELTAAQNTNTSLQSQIDALTAEIATLKNTPPPVSTGPTEADFLALQAEVTALKTEADATAQAETNEVLPPDLSAELHTLEAEVKTDETNEAALVEEVHTDEATLKTEESVIAAEPKAVLEELVADIKADPNA